MPSIRTTRKGIKIKMGARDDKAMDQVEVEVFEFYRKHADSGLSELAEAADEALTAFRAAVAKAEEELPLLKGQD